MEQWVKVLVIRPYGFYLLDSHGGRELTPLCCPLTSTHTHRTKAHETVMVTKQ